MNYVTSIFSSVKGYYDGINGATLTGALDVIVVRQPDGTFISSPFHVRFGKLNVLQSNEKIVDLTVNGRPVSLQMKLGANGEAFFVKPLSEDEARDLMEEDQYADLDLLSTSPIQTDSSPAELMRKGIEKMRQESTFIEEETDFSDTSDDDGQDNVYYGYTADDCLSDSELLTNQHLQQRMDSNNRIVWDWGTLPHENKKGPPRHLISADEEGTSFMRGMWEYMGRRRKRKNTYSHTIDVQEGMFLDDIDTEDPMAVSHYFGIRSARRNRVVDEIDADEMLRNEEKLRRLDALSLEAPRYYMNTTQFSSTESSGISIQTQTPTKPKRNKRTQTFDDSCVSDPEIVLSLCGDDLDLFYDYIVTYEQINDDHIGILDDSNLIVKCGNAYYNWFQMPNEVLIAMAFKESRSFIEEDGELERDRSLTYGSITEDLVEEEVRRPKYIKTVRLPSDEIASLELTDGANVLTFSVTTSYQGTTKCNCSIYLWDHTDKIIISDIDGTITRSDVFGHILPWVGKDWTQNNIAKLFSALHCNGYKFLYLSSRAIGQASMTKNFLKSIKQNGMGIPEGPMLLSPDSLLRTIKEELVLRRPHIFKIKCLSDIKTLFGEESTPFYAGFGNRASDSKSYQAEAVGIPPHRVYIINHRGEIYTENSLVQHCTYAEIYEHNEVYFPPLLPHEEEVEEKYLAPNFWRPDIPHLDEEDLLL